jgi:hypothetical protein
VKKKLKEKLKLERKLQSFMNVPEPKLILAQIPPFTWQTAKNKLCSQIPTTYYM